jgi:hypothetical protein
MSARYDDTSSWPADLVEQTCGTVESWADVVSFTMPASWGSHCRESEKPLRDSAFIRWIGSVSDERLEFLVSRFLSDKWVQE